MAKTILPGEGILEIFNWAKEGLDKVGSALGKLADGVGESFSAGVSSVGSVFGSVTNVSIGGMFSHEEAAPVQSMKLGGNARKQEILASLPVDTSGFGVDHNNVYAPATFNVAAANIGTGVQRS